MSNHNIYRVWEVLTEAQTQPVKICTWRWIDLYATMMELEDIADSKSAVSNGVWVQVPLVAPKGLDEP